MSSDGDFLSADFLAQNAKDWWGNYEGLEKIEFELNLIVDPKIRSLVMFLLSKADTFWTAAIASGEFDIYPEDECEEGGIVLHAVRSVRAFMLMEPVTECSNVERDCAIAALLLRNITRAIWIDEAKTETTIDPLHLYTVDGFVNAVVANAQINGEDVGQIMGVDADDLNMILRLIRTSAGYMTLIPETFPVTLLEKTVHFADLMATAGYSVMYGDLDKND